MKSYEFESPSKEEPELRDFVDLIDKHSAEGLIVAHNQHCQNASRPDINPQPSRYCLIAEL